MTIKTEVEMFPRECNWIEVCAWGDLIIWSHHDWFDRPDLYEVELIWYERPNEDHLLNTLTEALEGAYDYD